MTKSIKYAILVAAAAALTGSALAETTTGPLAEYVAKKDASYHWAKLRDGKLGEASFAELILTSQTWQDIVWKHRLFIIKPANIAAAAGQGVLVLSGGRWRDEYEHAGGPVPPPKEAAIFAAIAEKLKSPVAVLMQVPYQPMFEGKVEDAIISLTFERFLQTGDPEWPLLLPMVKSAVRAMDTVQQFCKDEWSIELNAFTVTGASKRGWTTWLTGAVDKRATAIAPMVIDMLNMPSQMQHQIEAWGDYSYKIHDYTDRGLQEQLGTDAGKRLQSIVDPYSYRQVLDQPKLILIGTNDHYWPLDALNLYWDDLAGENHILYIPNNGHDLRDFARIIGSLKALHEQAGGGKRLPRLSWKFEPGGGRLTLRVDSDLKPTKVQAWLATSATRDFRNAPWQARPMQAGAQAYVYELSRPQSGYAAIFGEAVYANDGTPFYLSTNVRIIGSEADRQAASEGESL